MKRSATVDILTLRLLILQSKRLLLGSAQRRLEKYPFGGLEVRVNRLRAEVELAQYAYRVAMLNFGSPQHSDYWVIAYSRLIEMGGALTEKLRSAVIDMPKSERFEVSADVEMLEEMVQRWQAAKRDSIAESVA